MQPLFKQLLELYESGNEKIACERLWSSNGSSSEEAKAVREAKEKYTA